PQRHRHQQSRRGRERQLERDPIPAQSNHEGVATTIAHRRHTMRERMVRHLLTPALVIVATFASGLAQAPVTPTNDAPNPYQTIEGWAKMPPGRTWGSTSAVDVAPDGTSIWVAERCGANTCWDAAAAKFSALDPVLLFDAGGKLVRSFGAGLFVFPHGIHV